MQNGAQYPVDNNTYNLMQALVSKLESIEAYQKYLQDANGSSRAVFQELIEEDSRHAERLRDTLKETMH